jgi:hypothetical protein
MVVTQHVDNTTFRSLCQDNELSGYPRDLKHELRSLLPKYSVRDTTNDLSARERGRIAYSSRAELPTIHPFVTFFPRKKVTKEILSKS